MRIIFFGTPDYVLPILELTHSKFSYRGVSPIVAVVTQPPRPVGRKQLKVFSPVDSWAFKKKLPIFHNASQILKDAPEAELGILASYGEIIPQAVIDYFPFGILNIHPSILPKWRGAAPVAAQIIAGEKVTGGTIIKLDQKLDHGPIVSQFKEDILDSDTAQTLRTRIFTRSAEVLVELLDPYLEGKIAPREQNHKEATLTTQIKKEDAFIPPEYLTAALVGKNLKEDWKIGFSEDLASAPTAETVERFIRAMDAWPVAWTYIQLARDLRPNSKKRLKILKAHLEVSALVLDVVQLEGKGPVSWKQFREAYAEATFAEP